jgi:lipopolysaccharide/colanic/teichoic acid biosynthesis glycosyltransferase
MTETHVQSQPTPALDGIPYCQSRAKRLLDIVGALVGMVLYTPVFLLTIGYVWLFERVPVFFFQARYGLGGEPFTIIKLRTMPYIERSHQVNADYIKKKPNYETTRSGKFMRRHSLDEIPQFWLVLKGDMSLVGHRAFPMHYLPHMADLPGMTPAKLETYLTTIGAYKPGMTALSAVNGRANLTLPQKIGYDIAYAERASFWLDVQILLRSIVVVITGEGAR